MSGGKKHQTCLTSSFKQLCWQQFLRCLIFLEVLRKIRKAATMLLQTADHFPKKQIELICHNIMTFIRFIKSLPIQIVSPPLKGATRVPASWGTARSPSSAGAWHPAAQLEALGSWVKRTATTAGSGQRNGKLPLSPPFEREDLFFLGGALWKWFSFFFWDSLSCLVFVRCFESVVEESNFCCTNLLEAHKSYHINGQISLPRVEPQIGESKHAHWRCLKSTKRCEKKCFSLLVHRETSYEHTNHGWKRMEMHRNNAGIN